jgi:hypothetical protein
MMRSKKIFLFREVAKRKKLFAALTFVFVIDFVGLKVIFFVGGHLSFSQQLEHVSFALTSFFNMMRSNLFREGAKRKNHPSMLHPSWTAMSSVVLRLAAITRASLVTS